MDGLIVPGIRALVKWDWSTSNAGGKWQDLGDIFNIEYSPVTSEAVVGEVVDLGDNVAVLRLGVQGSGRAMRFRFESIDNRPLTLHGWAVVGSEESNP